MDFNCISSMEKCTEWLLAQLSQYFTGESVSCTSLSLKREHGGKKTKTLNQRRTSRWPSGHENKPKTDNERSPTLNKIQRTSAKKTRYITKLLRTRLFMDARYLHQC